MTAFLNNDTPENAERVTSVWDNAPDNEIILAMILDTARVQVIAYASETEEDPDFTWSNPPARFVLAQLMQSQELWNSGRSSAEGTIGSSDYSFVPKSFSKTIRGIIRPESGSADVF